MNYTKCARWVLAACGARPDASLTNPSGEVGSANGTAATARKRFSHRLLTILLLTCACPSFGQQEGQTQRTTLQPAGSYVIGLDDQIMVRALHAPEISDKPIRIGSDGYITVELIGRVHASGLTVHALETEIKSRLAAYIQDPEVSINVLEFKSQPVSVLGAVKAPGVRQLEGPQSIIDMLSAAGGLDQDAGYTVTLMRRREWGPIPLARARSDASAQFSVADVNLPDLMEGKAPENNILIRPHDVITVPRAKLIYVIGEVHKSGGFAVREQESISVLQVLSLAEGLQRTAGPEHAKILRREAPGTEKKEIAVNVKRILDGKDADMALKPDDILFIPNSASKSVAIRTLEAAIQMGTGVVIWRH